MAFTDPDDTQIPITGQKIKAAWGVVVNADLNDHEGRITSQEGQLDDHEGRIVALEGGEVALADLTDTDLTDLAADDILQWNGTDWVPVDMPAGGGGTPDAHAASHEDGGSDELDVTSLGGFPGGSTDFLREDGIWAAPPGGGGGGGDEYHFLAANRSISSTTFADLTDLAFSIGANEQVVFEAMIPLAASSQPVGSKWQLTGPASPTHVWFGAENWSTTHDESTFSTGYTGIAAFPFTDTRGLTASGNERPLFLRGIIRNGANAGTVQVQWACEVAGTLTALQGGYLKVIRIP